MLELEYPYLPLFDNIEVSIAVKPFGGRWTNHTKKDEINDELQDFLETMSQGKLRACENSKCKPDVIHFYRRMIGQSIVVTFYSNAIVRTRQHLVEKGILDEKRIVRGLRGENFIPSEAFVKSVSKAELMEINRFHARQIIQLPVSMMSFFQRPHTCVADVIMRLQLFVSIKRCEVAIDTYLPHFLPLRERHLSYLNDNYKSPYRIHEYAQSGGNVTSAIEVRNYLTEDYYEKIVSGYAKKPDVWRLEITNCKQRHLRARLTDYDIKNSRHQESIAVYKILDGYKENAVAEYLKATWGFGRGF